MKSFLFQKKVNQMQVRSVDNQPSTNWDLLLQKYSMSQPPVPEYSNSTHNDGDMYKLNATETIRVNNDIRYKISEVLLSHRLNKLCRQLLNQFPSPILE
ncbi:hypothetical protein CAEBREN_15741 [Caenorhabditis brenneri]|uniref:Uncharacterized protein n=1 Tax=Caenorhabditis brenneri TaxID=135651 RepID=G0PDV9_CAEBE|nr:hypothetical protein CAEBREN_15741 [Caenorhabditis brenneri]